MARFKLVRDGTLHAFKFSFPDTVGLSRMDSSTTVNHDHL